MDDREKNKNFQNSKKKETNNWKITSDTQQVTESADMLAALWRTNQSAVE